MKESDLQLRIQDDGCGFNPDTLHPLDNCPDRNHFGWRGIRERAEQIGARVECQSAPGQGTTVILTVRTGTEPRI